MDFSGVLKMSGKSHFYKFVILIYKQENILFS